MVFRSARASVWGHMPPVKGPALQAKGSKASSEKGQSSTRRPSERAPSPSQRGAPSSHRGGKTSSRQKDAAAGEKKPKEVAAKVKKGLVKGDKEGARLSAREIKEAFATMDKDGSGTISVDELKASIPEGDESAAEIKEAIAEFDANGDGEISLAEFGAMMKSVAAGSRPVTNHGFRPTAPEAGAPLPITLPSELKKAFNTVDEDHSGTISMTELAQILKKGGDTLSDDDLAQVVAKFDVNGDGQISLKEFAAMMAAGASSPHGPKRVHELTIWLTSGSTNSTDQLVNQPTSQPTYNQPTNLLASQLTHSPANQLTTSQPPY